MDSIRGSRNIYAMVDDDSDDNRQLMFKKIVIGSYAKLLDKRKENKYTHRVKHYMKAHDDENLSNYICKVIFRIRGDCEKPTFIMTKPPFEFENYTLTEFHMTVTILYQDFKHSCTIHNLNVNLRQMAQKQTIHSYIVEEISFVDPTDKMISCLSKHQTSKQDVSLNIVNRTVSDGIHLEPKNELMNLNDEINTAFMYKLPPPLPPFLPTPPGCNFD